MIQQAGYRCTVGSPDLNEVDAVHGTSGPLMLNRKLMDNEERLAIEGKELDVELLLNNDPTEGEIPPHINQCHPTTQHGMVQTEELQYYEMLKPYVDEMAELLGIDACTSCPIGLSLKTSA